MKEAQQKPKSAITYDTTGTPMITEAFAFAFAGSACPGDENIRVPTRPSVARSFRSTARPSTASTPQGSQAPRKPPSEKRCFASCGGRQGYWRGAMVHIDYLWKSQAFLQIP